MCRRLVLCAIVSFLVFGMSAVSGAGPTRTTSSAPSDASTVADHVRRGDKARLAGRWAQAAAAYADALAAAERAGLPAPKLALLLGELGVCEVALSRYPDAAKHLHRSLEHPEDLTDEQQARYRAAKEKATSEVSTLVISVNPPAAELFMDDEPIPERRSVYLLFVEKGTHTFRARLAGYVDDVLSIDAAKGAGARLNLTLGKEPSTPSAVAPAPRAPLAASPPPMDTPAGVRMATFVTAGSGALIGAGLLISSVVVDDSTERRAEALFKQQGFDACNRPGHMDECNALRSGVRLRDELAGIGWGALAVSAALAGVGFSTYLWATPEGKRSVKVTATATGQHAGAVIRGTW